ncbi:MAG: hypothetical protein MHM6MM_000741 [Cercozoa sp. M6MM]
MLRATCLADVGATVSDGLLRRVAGDAHVSHGGVKQRVEAAQELCDAISEAMQNYCGRWHQLTRRLPHDLRRTLALCAADLRADQAACAVALCDACSQSTGGTERRLTKRLARRAKISPDVSKKESFDSDDSDDELTSFGDTSKHIRKELRQLNERSKEALCMSLQKMNEEAAEQRWMALQQRREALVHAAEQEEMLMDTDITNGSPFAAEPETRPAPVQVNLRRRRRLSQLPSLREHEAIHVPANMDGPEQDSAHDESASASMSTTQTSDAETGTDARAERLGLLKQRSNDNYFLENGKVKQGQRHRRRHHSRSTSQLPATLSSQTLFSQSRRVFAASTSDQHAGNDGTSTDMTSSPEGSRSSLRRSETNAHFTRHKRRMSIDVLTSPDDPTSGASHRPSTVPHNDSNGKVQPGLHVQVPTSAPSSVPNSNKSHSHVKTPPTQVTSASNASTRSSNSDSNPNRLTARSPAMQLRHQLRGKFQQHQTQDTETESVPTLTPNGASADVTPTTIQAALAEVRTIRALCGEACEWLRTKTAQLSSAEARLVSTLQHLGHVIPDDTATSATTSPVLATPTSTLSLNTTVEHLVTQQQHMMNMLSHLTLAMTPVSNSNNNPTSDSSNTSDRRSRTQSHSRRNSGQNSSMPALQRYTSAPHLFPQQGHRRVGVTRLSSGAAKITTTPPTSGNLQGLPPGALASTTAPNTPSHRAMPMRLVASTQGSKRSLHRAHTRVSGRVEPRVESDAKKEAVPTVSALLVLI